MKFAKLFETALGQILVMRQGGDNGPEIVFFFDPDVDGVGVCSFKIGYADSAEGEAKADAAFEGIDEENALQTAATQIEGIKEIFAEVQA